MVFARTQCAHDPLLGPFLLPVTVPAHLLVSRVPAGTLRHPCTCQPLVQCGHQSRVWSGPFTKSASSPPIHSPHCRPRRLLNGKMDLHPRPTQSPPAWLPGACQVKVRL